MLPELCSWLSWSVQTHTTLWLGHLRQNSDFIGKLWGRSDNEWNATTNNFRLSYLVLLPLALPFSVLVFSKNGIEELWSLPGPVTMARVT
jgi:hypothetical protein